MGLVERCERKPVQGRRALSAPFANKSLASLQKITLPNFANHTNMFGVVNQPKGGDPVSHCLTFRVIDEAWVIVPAKEFRA